MKKIGLKKILLWCSVIGNVLLFALVVCIGCVKTTYIASKLESLGIMKVDLTKREDYWCIRGWTNTLEKLHLDVDVVFFGNSLICGSSFENYFPNVVSVILAAQETRLMVYYSVSIKSKLLIQKRFS